MLTGRCGRGQEGAAVAEGELGRIHRVLLIWDGRPVAKRGVAAGRGAIARGIPIAEGISIAPRRAVADGRRVGPRRRVRNGGEGPEAGLRLVDLGYGAAAALWRPGDPPDGDVEVIRTGESHQRSPQQAAAEEQDDQRVENRRPSSLRMDEFRLLSAVAVPKCSSQVSRLDPEEGKEAADGSVWLSDTAPAERSRRLVPRVPFDVGCRGMRGRP